jgi:ubiquinone/menaquinone biosynthesis C-methylase UbiE
MPRTTRILDVGTGYADIPRVIVRWGERRQMRLTITALDHDSRILRLAGLASAAFPEIHFQHGDALALPYPDRCFDIVLASLILHHMEGREPVQLLRELYRVTRRAVVVNDLRRGRLPYLAGWAGLHLISRNRLIHHDGALSFRRGFRTEELLALARQAGWAKIRVSRQAFFRLALVGEKA